MQELQVNKENCFSVLMAVYKKEQPLFFKEALRSVFEQSLIPNEVVLVKDGPLTEELEQIIVDFSSKNEQLKVITLEKNQGLGSLIGHHIREGFHESHESFQNFLSYRIFLQISTSILSDDADRRKFSSETVKTCRALPPWYDKIFFRDFL